MQHVGFEKGTFNLVPLAPNPALELRKKGFAEGHWRIAEVQMALGDCLVEQGRYPEAEELLIASDSTLHKKFGSADPRTREATARLAKLYETWGKPDEAERHRAALR